jgi:hypothetical protein
MCLLLSAYLIILMFIVALDECIKIEISTELQIYVYVVEGLFVVDLLLNFLSVPPMMIKPNLK